MTRRTGQSPLNEIAQEERESQARFTSGRCGQLAMAVRDSQAYLACILAWHAVEDSGPDSHVLKALLALGATCFQLSRAAYLVVASGYPVQSLPLVRALYERVAMTLHLRSNADLAKEFVERSLPDRDLPKYASVAQSEIEHVFNDYTQKRTGVRAAPLAFADIKTRLGPLYGLLSSYTHPKMDAIPRQFLVNPETGKGVVALGPEELAQPYALPSMATHWFLLLVLQTALTADLWAGPSATWLDLVYDWESRVLAYLPRLALDVQKALNESTPSEV